MRIKKAIVPLAGLGMRWYPFSKVVAKELLPIGKKPAIHFIAEEIIEAGIEEVVFVISPNKTSVLKYFQTDIIDEKSASPEVIACHNEIKKIVATLKISVVFQEEAKGLSDAVLLAREMVGKEPFALVLPDEIFFGKPSVLKQVVNVFESNNKSVIALQEVSANDVSKYGIVDYNQVTNQIVEIKQSIEKPNEKDAPSNMSIIGRYVFTSAIFDALKNLSNIDYEECFTSALNNSVFHQNLLGFLATQKRYDIGNFEGFLEANNEIRRNESNAKTKNK